MKSNVNRNMHCYCDSATLPVYTNHTKMCISIYGITVELVTYLELLGISVGLLSIALPLNFISINMQNHKQIHEETIIATSIKFYLLVIMLLDCNKNSSAPPHNTNRSSRTIIMDPSTPPIIMLALILKSLLTTFSNPIEAGIMEEFI